MSLLKIRHKIFIFHKKKGDGPRQGSFPYQGFLLGPFCMCLLCQTLALRCTRLSARIAEILDLVSESANLESLTHSRKLACEIQRDCGHRMSMFMSVSIWYVYYYGSCGQLFVKTTLRMMVGVNELVTSEHKSHNGWPDDDESRRGIQEPILQPSLTDITSYSISFRPSYKCIPLFSSRTPLCGPGSRQPLTFLRHISLSVARLPFYSLILYTSQYQECS